MTLVNGGTVSTIVSSLKDQPLVLALVLMNFCLLGFLYYSGITATNERHVEMQLLYENRKYVTDILGSCIHVDQLEKLLRNKQ